VFFGGVAFTKRSEKTFEHQQRWQRNAAEATGGTTCSELIWTQSLGC
jgi:hypothetical protein